VRTAIIIPSLQKATRCCIPTAREYAGYLLKQKGIEYKSEIVDEKCWLSWVLCVK
jgi:hypothetical protein